MLTGVELKLKILLLLRLKKKAELNKIKRRWGVRPVIQNRKKCGEFLTSFLKYKIVDHEWFFLYTRMNPSQFDEVLALVGPVLQKRSHREPLSPSQRLAITLRYQSQGDPLFCIASGYKRTISTKPSSVDNVIKATVCLHKFIKQKEYSLPDAKRKYCPQSLCDKDSDNGVIEGEWRREVGNQFNILLEETECTGRGGHNPGKDPLAMREKLVQYLISSAGSLAGQVN
ncbi:hypothetical protein QE152_g9449 [Popillia japonica]|uniref:Uncharacterized protein n=1 Tax=Popillia japonica TaxID=7064 RepID=A0AAW1LYE2_POPJA